MQRSRLRLRKASLGSLPIQAAKKVCSARLGVDVTAGANTFFVHAHDECVGGGLRFIFRLFSKDPVVCFVQGSILVLSSRTTHRVFLLAIVPHGRVEERRNVHGIT
jgi:hypothetical protein